MSVCKLALTAPFTRFIFPDLAVSVSREQRGSLGKFPLQLGREEPVAAEVLEKGATRRLRVGTEAALRAKRKGSLITTEGTAPPTERAL